MHIHPADTWRSWHMKVFWTYASDISCVFFDVHWMAHEGILDMRFRYYMCFFDVHCTNLFGYKNTFKGDYFPINKVFAHMCLVTNTWLKVLLLRLKKFSLKFVWLQNNFYGFLIFSGKRKIRGIYHRSFTTAKPVNYEHIFQFVLFHFF